MTRMPAVQEKVKELTGKDPHKRRQPGRGRGRGRRHPGGRAGRRRQGRAAARRHPADPRHRDQGRRDDQADRAQHHDPDAQVGDLLDGRGQPAGGGGARAPGRARDGRLQQVARQVPAHRHPAGAARRAADRGRRSTSTPTASSTCRPRTSAPARSRRSRSRPAPASPTTRSSGWSRTPRRTPTRTAASASSSRRATAAENAAYQAERQLKEMGDSVDASSKEEIEAAIKDVRDNLESEDADAAAPEDRGAAGRLPQGLRADVRRGAAAGSRPAATARPPTAPAGDASADEEEVVDAEVVDGEEQALAMYERARPAGGGAGDRARRGRRARGRARIRPTRRRSSRTASDESGEQATTRARRARGPARARQRERDEYLDLAQRTQADFENYRKRAAKEAAAAGERAKSGLVRELLPVVDNLERALASAEEARAAPRRGRAARALGAARGARAQRRRAVRPARASRSTPTVHEALSTRERGRRRARHGARRGREGLPAERHGAASGARGGLGLTPMPAVKDPYRTSASTRRPPTTRSRRPTASSRASTTRTRTRATRRAEERFKEVQEAYSILSDPEKRKRLRLGRRHLRRRLRPGRRLPGRRRGGGFGGFGDILSDLFGGADRRRRAGGRTPRPERGRDLETEVHISFEQAMEGAQVPVSGAAVGSLPDLPRHRRQAGHPAHGLLALPGPRRRGGVAGAVLDLAAVPPVRRHRHRDQGPVPHLRRQRAGPARSSATA